MSIKVIYSENKAKYYKDGNSYDHPKFSWNSLSVDNRFGKKISVLTESRIGISSEDEDTPFSINISINGSTFVTSEDEEIILSVDIEDDNGQVINPSDKKIQWNINDDLTSNDSVFSLNSDQLIDRQNNIIRVKCIIDGFELEDSISILKYIGFSEDEDQDQDEDTSSDIMFEISEDTIIYDITGRIVNDPIEMRVSGISNADIEFLIDGYTIQKGNRNMAVIPENMYPSGGNRGDVKVIVRRSGDIIFEDSKTLYTRTVDFDTNPEDQFATITTLSSGTLETDKQITFDISLDMSMLPATDLIRRLFRESELRVVNWDFGDGSGDTDNSFRINHTYEESGIYIVTATIIFASTDDPIVTKKLIKIND